MRDVRVVETDNTGSGEQDNAVYRPEYNRNEAICAYCVNRGGEACTTRCRPEGRYRYLEPETLDHWELPPELPPYREMVDLPAPEVRAIIWLHAYYQSWRDDQFV